MNRSTPLIAALAIAIALPASAQVPPAAKVQAAPFLAAAGQSDVYEITSSQIALKRSKNAAVREFATGMIRDHTTTTNNALAAAKKGGVTPPPPVLDAAHRAMITELQNAQGAAFDKLYWQQQLKAHQAALELMQGYAKGGDTPSLRQAATATVPIIERHLEHIRMAQSGGM